jgi:hypothetical protein
MILIRVISNELTVEKFKKEGVVKWPIKIKNETHVYLFTDGDKF